LGKQTQESGLRTTYVVRACETKRVLDSGRHGDPTRGPVSVSLPSVPSAARRLTTFDSLGPAPELRSHTALPDSQSYRRGERCMTRVVLDRLNDILQRHRRPAE